MSDEANPVDGKDSYTRDRMQKIARLIDEELPDGWGFFVLAFPFGKGVRRCNYISNANRDAIVNEMRAFIRRHEAGENIFSHLK